MRKFRFIGNPDDYKWEISLKKRTIYPYNTVVYENGSSLLDVLDRAKKQPLVSGILNDWEEVFENEYIKKYPLTPDDLGFNYINPSRLNPSRLNPGLAVIEPINEEKFINDCAVHAMNSWLRMQGSNPKRIAKDSFDMAYAMNEERKRRLNE